MSEQTQEKRGRMSRIATRYKTVLTVVALNLVVMWAILMINAAGASDTWLAWLYASTVTVGYYGLPLMVLASLVFVIGLPFGRGAVFAAVGVITIFTCYLLIDALAYRIVKFHIDLFWIEYALKDYAGLGLPAASVVLVGVIVLAMVALQIGILFVARRRQLRRVMIALPLLTIAAFTFSQIVHLIAYEWNNQRITALTPHFPLYVPITSHSNAPKYRELMPWVEAHAKTQEPEHLSMSYPLVPMQYEPPGESGYPNVVIIMLESWRYDTMTPEVSPNIHRLSEKSAVFLDHLSSGNQTTCGVFGFFYGLHATYWTAVKANSSAIDNPVFIDVMTDNGYDIGVFAKSRFKRHKIKDTVFRGIEVHQDFKGKNNASQDEDLTRQMIDFIEEKVRNDEPYMAYAFYKSTHAPYEYPKDHVVFEGSEKVRMGFTHGKTNPEPHLQHYRNAVHYTDMLAGRILDRLEELDQMDNTVIIISTDHGESFNDTGDNYWGHGTSYTQYQTRVPLVVYLPNRGHETVTRRTAHVDIVPTVLTEAFGCTNDPADYSNGRNLFDSMADVRPIVIGSYTNHAYVLDDNVYEIFPIFTKKYKLYDSEAEATPLPPELIRIVRNEVTRFTDR